uniref:Uncharacterized protein n=1 Tax=Megaselia scalaris TaxID=36166 RepID=T1H0C1_MEGSC
MDFYGRNKHRSHKTGRGCFAAGRSTENG